MPISVPKSNPQAPYESGEARNGSEEDVLHYFESVMCEFLQILFSRRPAGDFRWNEDEKTSEIKITSASPLTSESRGDHPAIVILVGPISSVHLGLDDLGDLDQRTGVKVRRMLKASTYSLQCLSRNRTESLKLASICETAIWSYRDTLHRRGKFFSIGQNIAVGQTTPPGSLVADDGGEGLLSTPVSVPFYFPWVVYVTPLDKQMVREVEVSIRGGLGKPPPRSTPVPDPLVPGVCHHGPRMAPYRIPPEGALNTQPILRPATYPGRPRKGDLPQPPSCMGTSQQLLVRFRAL